jgi:uncharacterized protein YdeI (YjbR/CyaY-like superfamily)
LIRAKTVDDYIDSAPEWAVEKLIVLRQLAINSGLKEEVKWGAPSYSGKGIVLGLAAFKGWVSLWFHQGSFLKDEHKKLLAAAEKTKGLRQWRLLPEERIDETLILKYMLEAKANDLAGKKIKAESKKVETPKMLLGAFSNDGILKSSFEALSPGKQKEYAEHIGSAKREAAQVSRLEKSIPLIKEGIGLNDKYKNC